MKTKLTLVGTVQRNVCFGIATFLTAIIIYGQSETICEAKNCNSPTDVFGFLVVFLIFLFPQLSVVILFNLLIALIRDLRSMSKMRY